MRTITRQQIAELPESEKRKLHNYINRSNRRTLKAMAHGRIKTELEIEDASQTNPTIR